MIGNDPNYGLTLESRVIAVQEQMWAFHVLRDLLITG